MIRASAKGVLWLAFVALLLAGRAQAAAIVETLTGEASAGPSLTRTAPIAKGQRIDSGNYIVTGAKSLVVLGFDDGQKMVLNENTQFRITSYSFKQDEPKKDRFSFDLLKGALRAVTSLFARRNPNAYAMRTPQATIGIRGTDFMLYTGSPGFGQVISGQIGATSSRGTAFFGPGSTFSMPSSNVLPFGIPPGSLPPNVLAMFQQMQALSLTVGGAGAGGAGAAAAGGLNPAWLIVPAVVGAAVAGGGGGGGSSGPTGSSGTTAR
jgi:hypothetical protein